MLKLFEVSYKVLIRSVCWVLSAEQLLKCKIGWKQLLSCTSWVMCFTLQLAASHIQWTFLAHDFNSSTSCSTLCNICSYQQASLIIICRLVTDWGNSLRDALHQTGVLKKCSGMVKRKKGKKVMVLRYLSWLLTV